MSRSIRFSMILLVIAVTGLAQWFFGNLYEAVVTAPNARVGFEYEAMTGRSQFEQGSPMRFYVPTTQIATLLLWVATFLNWKSVPAARRWLVWGSILSLSATVLTIYIVTQLNLKLFFGEKTLTFEEAEPLMRRWSWLNHLRLVLVGATLASAINALRITHRESILLSSN